MKLKEITASHEVFLTFESIESTFNVPFSSVLYGRAPVLNW